MPFVTANGLRLHVQHLGDSAAPPVVMVHGMLSGSLASWYFGLAPVVAESHHVVLYDQRGHGLSERPLRGYTLTELAADLDAVTEALGPCVLVGHSFGGLVALRHAMDHPRRVNGVALVDSFIPAPPSPAGRGSRRRRATGEQILLGGTTVLSDLRRDSQLDPAAWADLRIPLLCTMGSASPFRNEVEWLARRLRSHQSRFAMLDGGHALHLDAPVALAEVVTKFLGEPLVECGGAVGGSRVSGSRAGKSKAAGSRVGGLAVGAGAQGGRHG
jgi:pimeloyl-ACP methyl ester carboxylesterase